MPDSLFAQPLFKFSLVYLLVWHPPLYTPYISYPITVFFFATHAHTNATHFAVVPRLCHLILLSLSTLYLELSLFFFNVTHPSDHSHLCHKLYTFCWDPYWAHLPCDLVIGHITRSNDIMIWMSVTTLHNDDMFTPGADQKSLIDHCTHCGDDRWEQSRQCLPLCSFLAQWPDYSCM